MTDAVEKQPRRRRSGGRRGNAKASPKAQVERKIPIAGNLKPLSESDIAEVHAASLEILDRIGLNDAPRAMIDLITARGGRLTGDGRLTFPPALVAVALARLRRGITLHGRAPAHDLELSDARVYAGTGGASPFIVDPQDGRYRAATLADLYDAARLVGTLDHVQFFSRPMIVGDMPTAHTLDVNTAFACLAGTSKHVIVSASEPAHISDIAGMCYLIAGSEQAFRAQPFLSVNINHAVPPLRFDPEACGVMARAVELGIPVMVNTFGQMGASSPVTIAGCLAQTNAETLAGMVYAWALDPDVRAIYGARPMVTDLRTGGMAGGGGEQAILTAAATQLARHYDLPNSTIAGANLITQAGLMATSFEAYVIDNDMLGAVLQAAVPIEVNTATLSIETIAQTVRGEGHFLGNADTFARMESDFVYPEHADRQAPEAWFDNGAPAINASARKAVSETLATHFPRHIPLELEKELRSKFDIRLPEERMRPG